MDQETSVTDTAMTASEFEALLDLFEVKWLRSEEQEETIDFISLSIEEN